MDLNKQYTGIKFFWSFVLSFLIPFVGGLISIYIGIKNFNKKGIINIYEEETYFVSVKDKRFSTGNRPERKTRQTLVSSEPDSKQSERNKRTSVGYLVIGISSILFYIYKFII